MHHHEIMITHWRGLDTCTALHSGWAVFLLHFLHLTVENDGVAETALVYTIGNLRLLGDMQQLY